MTEARHNPQAKVYGPYEFALGDELRGERATQGKSLLDVQRDLRIKAAYIAAIENAEPDVFPNPGFIAGYVRSYARYLSLDPDEVYHRFCEESGFEGPARAQTGKGNKQRTVADTQRSAVFRPDFPMANFGAGGPPSLPLSAIGSLAVLTLLTVGLAYGGWTVLQNIQRVQFAPVEELPLAEAEMSDLAPPKEASDEPSLPELASPVAAAALVDLYRRQELEVPILVPRDGPIAAIDPDRVGLLARPDNSAPAPFVSAKLEPFGPPDGASPSEPLMVEPQVVANNDRLSITVLAERAAWVRVYLENGTILFERILERGESFELPEDAESPLIWAGNSGSVYLRLGTVLHGPIGNGTRAVRNVVLEPEAIVERFAEVSEVPEVISETISNLAHNTDSILIQ